MQEQPSYYCIIPANVRYDKRLSASQKLMYGEITSLTQANGVCWATNKYFAELYDVTRDTASKWINKLVEYGYITNEITFINGTNRVDKRMIKLSTSIPPIDENNPIDKKDEGGIDKKDDTLSTKMSNSNNTSVNTTSKNKEDLFEVAWMIYDYKKNKQKAKSSFLKLKESEIEEIKKHLPEYVNSTFTDGKYPSRLHLSTYLNQRRWEDEITQPVKERGTLLTKKATGAFSD